MQCVCARLHDASATVRHCKKYDVKGDAHVSLLCDYVVQILACCMVSTQLLCTFVVLPGSLPSFNIPMFWRLLATAASVKPVHCIGCIHKCIHGSFLPLSLTPAGPGLLPGPLAPHQPCCCCLERLPSSSTATAIVLQQLLHARASSQINAL